MMARNALNDGALVAAGALVVAAGFIGSWRLSIRHEQKNGLPKESWQRIKEEYPLPSEQVSDVVVPTETFTAFLAANPFSPQRRQLPPPSDQAGGSGEAGREAKPPAPKFIYKGRMQLGSRQRAILEDSSIGKTYFLEVGQGVANFKVLDIDEKRVLLSDPLTHEEVAVSLTSTAGP